MNFLNEIKKHKLIDESLLPIIFGELLDDEDYWYSVKYDFSRIAKTTLWFYFGLIQCYCFAEAYCNTKKLGECKTNINASNAILDIWNVDKHGSFNSDGKLFSHLINYSSVDTSVLFTPSSKDTIILVRDICAESSSNSRELLGQVSEETIFEFFNALPLLKRAVFSPENMTFRFDEFKNFPIKSSPFISFLDFSVDAEGEPVDRITFDCYILTSVSKGTVNDELFFDTVRLDATGSENDKKRISRQLRDNESLKLLCRTAGFETQWYPIDYCWCDLKFLNKMVSASEGVILNYCGIDDPETAEKDTDIKRAVEIILEDTEIIDSIKTRNSLFVKDLYYILFELFLNEGIFKTVKCIVTNPPNIKKASSEAMFEQYLNEFVFEGIMTQEHKIEVVEKSDKKIAESLAKLAQIVSPKDDIYQKRKSEIEAEWQTYYILRAAGIKNSNLFADVETILSIDDFYDMLKNDNSSTEEGLSRVLRILCIFYKALLSQKNVFSEERFLEDVSSLVDTYKLSEHTIESLFDEFIEIAKECAENSDIEELLGRDGIANQAVESLSFYKRKIIDSLNNPSSCLFNSTSKGIHTVFISYAHDDLEKVKPIVEHWQEMGIDFFFDKTDIHAGQDWQRMAERCIDSDRCKLVIAFCSKLSVRKEGVMQELRHAKSWENRKRELMKDDNYSFIIPINLEEENLQDYLEVAAEKEDDKDVREFAKNVRNSLGYEPSFLSAVKSSPETLDSKIKSLYSVAADSDGRIVTPFRLDNFKHAVANFYAYLKFGGERKMINIETIDDYFNDESRDLSQCIYPIVASVKETRIKRDSIAIVGYEMIRGKGRKKSSTSCILTSRVLDVDDYYCIPKYRNIANLRRSDKFLNLKELWMIEPILVRCDKFLDIISQTGK